MMSHLMTEEEYNIRISKIKQKKIQLEERMNSLEFIFPPIDFESELGKLVREVEELLLEIGIEQFLEAVDQLLIDEGYLNENKERIQ